MTLSSGQHLGQYEILSPLGAGGMGEVYRARDNKLGREVAIKVLLEAVAGDRERLARFEREAKTLAAVNHHNIATLHGFEQDGEVHFLVMELVAGETLADRLARGPLQVDEAISLFMQIAEGLEAAHQKGVIHRDLKPANIKITPEGQVKLLDFGLAKALVDEPAKDDRALSHSPTMTLDATRRGEILGTAAYMSPEQARGQPVDRRTDVWAFGVCLFEALGGRPPFEGETAMDILSGVLEREPDWSALARAKGGVLDTVVRRCLRKDPKQRLHDIADVRIELAEIDPEAEGVLPALTDQSSPRSFQSSALLVAAGLIVGAGLAGAIATLFFQGDPATSNRQPWTFAPTVDPPPRSVSLYSAVALSSDGRAMIYDGGIGSEGQLFLREAAAGTVRALAGTTGCAQPFFSPDGLQAGFFCYGSDGFSAELRRTSFGEEEPFRMTDILGPMGGSWGPDDQIVIGQLEGPLVVVSATGGQIQELTELEGQELAHTLPEVLPNGKGVLFVVLEQDSTEDYYNADIYVYDFETQATSLVIEGGTQPQYVAAGFVVFARAGTLFAVRFDEDRLSAEGPTFQVRQGVGMNIRTGSAHFSVARDEGTMAYLRGAAGGFQARRSLVWIDHQGEVEELTQVPRNAFATPRLSPNGDRVAVAITERGNRDIWIYDLESGAPVRITEHPTADWAPFWSSDGEAILFSSLREDRFGLYRKRADGAGALELLLSAEALLSPLGWAADGSGLIYLAGDQILQLEKPGDDPVSRSLSPESLPQDGTLSPDTGLIAYRSPDSAGWRVYVQDFPSLSWKKAIYAELANEPLWSRDGKQLFFRSGSDLLKVDVETEPSFEFSAPETLFSWPWVFESGRDYDVSLDGGRFLMVREGDPESRDGDLVVVQGWFEELERLAPKP